MLGGMRNDNVANLHGQKTKDGWIIQVTDDTSNTLMYCETQELSHRPHKSWDYTSVLLKFTFTFLNKKEVINITF